MLPREAGGRRFKQAGLPAECVVLDCLDVRENRWVLNSVTSRSHRAAALHTLGKQGGDSSCWGQNRVSRSRQIFHLESCLPQWRLNWILRVIFRQIPTTNLLYVTQYPLTPAWETCSAGWENLLTTALYWQIEFEFAAK